MSRFMKASLTGLKPYTPGEQPRGKPLIKLNTNENPYPPSPKVVEALVSAGEQRLYPDPTAGEAVRAVAAYHDLEESQVLLGNGSDEILAFAYMAYGDKVVFPEISYGFYPVFAGLFGSRAREIPLDPDLRIRPEDYYDAGATVIIANPNAPTGLALSRREVESILKRNKDNVVIIDEAYVDFGGESSVSLIEEYDNLLVVQTFSKSRSLAGMRIGVALGQSQLIDDLDRVKYSFNPYNLSRDAILAAKASIEDETYFKETVERIKATRKMFSAEMEALGCRVLPSSANFVFVEKGKDYFQALRKRGILVRHFDKEPISGYVRITIGTEEEMKELLRVTEEII
ncbi:MAG: histidinol-phosphate transaminase [Anaerovoracaceae bacterium]|jgi:histidinol-phosphate aminotransferase